MKEKIKALVDLQHRRFDQFFTSEQLKKIWDTRLSQFAILYADKVAASGHHHYWPGGLLVHTFEMLDILWGTYMKHPNNAKKFNIKSKADNDKFQWQYCALAILYHDFGKVYEYESTPNEYGKYGVTYAMRQLGHIYISSYTFQKDASDAQVSKYDMNNIVHCILAHHTFKAWGSPVEPISPEARIVSACDMISSYPAEGKDSYLKEYLEGIEEEPNDKENIYSDIVAPAISSFKEKLKLLKEA